MKDKYPHFYEYQRRCRLISDADEDYYDKYWKEIRREQEEVNSTWMERYKLGGNKEIHKFKEYGC